MSKTPRSHSDDDEKRQPGKGGKTAAWILTILLVIGLGGFGVTNFGGSVTSIGSVGDTRITTQDYARSVQQEVAAFSAQVGTQIGITEALAFGLDRQALSTIVTRTALDNEAARLGLSIGDASVAAEVMKNAAFQGASGSFDRETYRFVLGQQGWNEADFETATAATCRARCCRARSRAASRRRSRWSTRSTAGSPNGARSRPCA